MMTSEFNSYSLEEEIQENEIVLGESERFVFYKKRIYGRMHFLKRPSPKYENDLVTLESLRKEFAIGYSLDHPNIAKYLRFEKCTLLEEYIDGKSLRELIQDDDPRLRDKRFLQNLGLQFIDVLRYLREAGVVHNDIKPENVIISRIGNTLKLVDFNCAQSSANDILGGFSLPYKAPEQGSGTVDCSSDLYQVGKVMEELCDQAGYNRGWKRFIKGATAADAAKRISLEEAEKLLTGQSKFKKLPLVFLSLTILGLVAIMLFSIRQPEPTAIQPESSASDTVIIRTVVQPSEGSIPERHEPGTVDVKKVIDKKILDYTDYYYKTNIYPLCREALETDNKRLTREEEIELQKAIEKAYRAATDFGAKLSLEYPAERNFIERECLHSFEMKISGLLLRLYPAGGEQPAETGK